MDLYQYRRSLLPNSRRLSLFERVVIFEDLSKTSPQELRKLLGRPTERRFDIAGIDRRPADNVEEMDRKSRPGPKEIQDTSYGRPGRNRRRVETTRQPGAGIKKR